MGKPTTGAKAGRLGGKIGAKSKLLNRLKKLPRFKTISKVEKKKKKRRPAVSLSLCEQHDAEAVAGAASSMSAGLDLTPRRADLVRMAVGVGFALHKALAYGSGTQQPEPASQPSQQAKAPKQPVAFSTPNEPDAAAPYATRRASKRPMQQAVPAPPPKRQRTGGGSSGAAGSSTADEPVQIGGGKRGEQFVVQAKSTYGAGKTYDWSDVVTACKLLADGTIKLKDLDELSEDGITTIYKVPRTSLTSKWLKDDHVMMQLKTPPARGVAGTAHWRVELEVRGRTSLDKAGPSTVLGGAVEDKLMLTISNAAKKGWQYVPRRRRHPPPPPPPPAARERLLTAPKLHVT